MHHFLSWRECVTIISRLQLLDGVLEKNGKYYVQYATFFLSLLQATVFFFGGQLWEGSALNTALLLPRHSDGAMDGALDIRLFPLETVTLIPFRDETPE